jgi:hypothetical protein
MLAVSRDEVIPREKAGPEAQRVILMLFFSGVSLITVDALPSSAQFTHGYFINKILPDIVEARGRIFRKVGKGEFFVEMDNAMHQDGRKMTDEFANLKLDHVPHSFYSPDLSPCNCWLFRMLKQKIKDRPFPIVDEIMIAFHKIWDELTLDDLASVFLIGLNDLNRSVSMEKLFLHPISQDIFAYFNLCQLVSRCLSMFLDIITYVLVQNKFTGW